MLKKLCVTILVILLISGCSVEEDRLDLEQVREDLSDFKEKINMHHQAFEENNELAAAFEAKFNEVLSNLDKPLTDIELFVKISELMSTLKDAHGYVIYPKWVDEEFLPLSLLWVEEGLIVNESLVEGIRKGDKIVSINNKSTESLLHDFERIFPAENMYWVKHHASIRIPQAHILKALNLVNENGTVTLNIENISGEVNEINVTFYNEPVSSRVLPLVETSYYQDHSVALFRLNRCEDSAEVREALDMFFQDVKRKDIDSVVLDLRFNWGGNLRVIERFMSYIDIEAYDNYYNSSNGPHTRKNNINENSFDGKLYVATSSQTFSTANLLAGVIKYNYLGKTIGEPTGNATYSYGYSQIFQLPNSGLQYNVSKLRWFVPNAEYEPTIRPDIYIPLTREHIINDIDPILEWIMERDGSNN